jgi:ribosomal protein S18 acetylase RimI-like enzyme
MTRITDLVNHVYAVSERGLWQDDATRTTVDEVRALSRAGELVVAEHSGEVTGVVRVQMLDGQTGEFGMLAVDPTLRGHGIGRDLVHFAEDFTRDSGRRYMQLELLVPRDWVLESKQFLAAWYDRIGYQLQRVGRIEESYPDLAPMLGTPADFRTYRKEL